MTDNDRLSPSAPAAPQRPSVSMTPDVMSGDLVVDGTRIPVAALRALSEDHRMTTEDIVGLYPDSLTSEQIEWALEADRRIRERWALAVPDPDDLRMPDATEEEADDMAGEAVWRCPKCNGTGFIVSTQGARKCISCKVEMQFMVALCDLCELPLSDHGKDGCHDARAVNRATDVALSESNDHRDEKKASSTSEVPASTKLDVPTGSGPEGHGAANSAHPAPVRSPSSDPGKTDGAWYVPCREGKHVQCPQGHIDGHADCACPCHIGYDLGHRAGYGIGRYDEKHGQDDLYWLSRPAPESSPDAEEVMPHAPESVSTVVTSPPADTATSEGRALRDEPLPGASVDAGDSARIDHIADIIVANVGGYGGTGIPAHAPDAAKEILAYLAGASAGAGALTDAVLLAMDTWNDGQSFMGWKQRSRREFAAEVVRQLGEARS